MVRNGSQTKFGSTHTKKDARMASVVGLPRLVDAVTSQVGYDDGGVLRTDAGDGFDLLLGQTCDVSDGLELGCTSDQCWLNTTVMTAEFVLVD